MSMFCACLEEVSQWSGTQNTAMIEPLDHPVRNTALEMLYHRRHRHDTLR
jgi:hypothetical protein